MVKVALSPHQKEKIDKIEALKYVFQGLKKQKQKTRRSMIQIWIQHLQPQSFCKSVQVPILWNY